MNTFRLHEANWCKRPSARAATRMGKHRLCSSWNSRLGRSFDADGAAARVSGGPGNGRVRLPVVCLLAQHELPTVLTDLAGGQFAKLAELIQ
jgi:hypothetical protein